MEMCSKMASNHPVVNFIYLHMYWGIMLVYALRKSKWWERLRNAVTGVWNWGWGTLRKVYEDIAPTPLSLGGTAADLFRECRRIIKCPDLPRSGVLTWKMGTPRTFHRAEAACASPNPTNLSYPCWHWVFCKPMGWHRKMCWQSNSV